LGLLSPPTPRERTQGSPGVSALTLLNAAVQELIVIDRDHFNLLKAYISSVESPYTVDSTSSNLRLLPWLDIGIVSTLPCLLHIVLRVVYLSGYHTLFNLFRVPPRCTVGPTARGTHKLLVSIGFILVGVLAGLLAF
jgi:hypothetical protein